MIYLLLKTLHLLSDFLFVAGVLINGACLMARPQGMGPVQLSLARRLNMRMTSPALFGVWVFGLALVFSGNWWPDGWLLAKMAIVLALSALHGMQTAAIKRLSQDPAAAISAPARHSFVLSLAALLLIVALVVLKPF
ncbi:CopD family protein [Rhizobium halophytocola]|uniref:Protoporphyrinogen IX oxidase n=1 Tax=Rhizobium halophytocola TaxID=735519 RepID=A0ABS4DSJ9_9HYPH|nr:CopD family protein [Rhizobium halophytocola]MBP1848661.1 putative membrane protein [Rhizobium halophytocola]